MVKAAETKVVRPDTLTLDGRSASVVTAGVVLNKFQPGPLSMIDQKDLKRIIIRNGLPGTTTRTIEYLVKGQAPSRSSILRSRADAAHRRSEECGAPLHQPLRININDPEARHVSFVIAGASLSATLRLLAP